MGMTVHRACALLPSTQSRGRSLPSPTKSAAKAKHAADALKHLAAPACLCHAHHVVVAEGVCVRDAGL